MSVYKNRDETISCTKCGKQLEMAEAYSHACRIEKVGHSEPVDSLVDGSIANLVNHDPKQVLWDLLSEFIQAHEIKTPDTIVLHNIHLQHGFELLADICDIVGWYEEGDDDKQT